MTGAATAGADLAGTGETITFWVVAVLAVVCALGVVVATKAVYSALCLAGTMLLLAVAYLAQGAMFLGVVQVVVYTGAVMMLFLFVVMLVGTRGDDEDAPPGISGVGWHRLVAAVVGVAFGLVLIGLISRASIVGQPGGKRVGTIDSLADLIFVRYVWTFELTAALLITATVGALVLAHHERTTPKPTQRELSELRFREGLRPTPLPNPGVYAFGNSVDLPGLLPDGTPDLDSVNHTLTPRAVARATGDTTDKELR